MVLIHLCAGAGIAEDPGVEQGAAECLVSLEITFDGVLLLAKHDRTAGCRDVALLQ
ncbi:hypothetical protein Pla22_28990 [Rubripirellula amarantea]|uniref:Uncharacterized protein n=1 Tax=Rubripirellula amarantea TaxID=2527999 RepID=A0A5C5WJ46_9BACT|nr:hypothetical protein Pla22_28990 [Rubripirellula amarantea]